MSDIAYLLLQRILKQVSWAGTPDSMEPSSDSDDGDSSYSSCTSLLLILELQYGGRTMPRIVQASLYV